MLKVCFVLHQFPELSQTFVLRQILNLINSRHDVSVIAARPGKTADAADMPESLRQLMKHRTRYTSMPGPLIRRLVKGFRVAPALMRTHPQALLTSLDVRRFGWFAASGSLLTTAAPIVAEPRRYDAIIAHFGPQGMLAQGLREMGVLRGPLCTFFHAYDLTAAPRLVGRHMYRRLFDRGDLQLAVSQRGATHLIHLGAPTDRIRVHHMGVNTNVFRPASTPKPIVGGRPIRIISIGRLVEKKGFKNALEAIAKVKASGIHVEYVIHGEGPLARPLDRLIDCLGLRGVATLRGSASHDCLAEELRSSDILLAPSITATNGDEEGIPMVLMEAMATELPVITTDSGAICELVEHRSSGLIVKERDNDELARAICLLATSPLMMSRLGRAGRETVLRAFDEASQTRQLVELLTQFREGIS